jgi:hypothetical protein
MRHKLIYRIGLMVLVMAAVGLGVIQLLQTAVVQAQGGKTAYSEPVDPLPAVNEGDATWTIAAQEYEAEFPVGLTFAIEAVSTGGEIVNARVVWTHAPGGNTQRSRGAEYNEETGRWVAFWEHNSGDVPPWVLVRYHWELTDEAGNRYVTAQQDEVYSDPVNVDRWGSTENEDVVVYWIDLPDEYGTQTLEAMSQQREFYRQAWGGLLPYRPRVILYGTSARLEYEQALGRPAAVGGGITTGTTSDDWGGTIQYSMFGDSASSLAYGTVLHEVAHLYQGEFAHLPVGWFIEGNAEFFSLSRGDSYREWGRRRLMSDDPLSFATGFSIRGRTFRDGYQLGATVFDYLVDTYGLDAHRQIWELIGQNTPPYDAIEQVTGISIEAFELDWRQWMGVNTPAPTPAPTLTPMFDIFSFPTPTYTAPGG